MKYDDASWHYGGKFPADLPPEAGATHTGMFLAWALLTGLAGDIYIEDFPESIPTLQSRSTTPGAFFRKACDGKFTDEDLSDEGNEFVQHYFDFEKGQYLTDYRKVTGYPEERIYYVPDTWDTFDLLQPVIDKRYAAWKKERR